MKNALAFSQSDARNFFMYIMNIRISILKNNVIRISIRVGEK